MVFFFNELNAQKSISKKTNSISFFQQYDMNVYFGKTNFENLSPKMKLHSQNPGFQLNYSLGLIQNDKYGISGGMSTEVFPTGFLLRINKDDFNFNHDVREFESEYSISVGIFLKSFYNIKLNEKYKLNFSLAYQAKYFLTHGYSSGVGYGDLIDNKDIQIYKATVTVPVAAEYGFSNYLFGINLQKKLKSPGLFFLYGLKFNLCNENVAEGNIILFEGEDYENKVNYEKTGNFILLNFGYIFFKN